MSVNNQEDIDCRSIFESIEKNTKELLCTDLSQKMKDDIIKAINDRVDLIHHDLDKQGDDFINKVLNNFNLKEDESKDNNKNPIKPNKQDLIRKKKIEEISNLIDSVEMDYQLKMEELIYSISQMMNKVSVIDISCKTFKDNKLVDLISFGKEEIRFKLDKKIAHILRGKNSIELIWDDKNNKSYSTVDKNDTSNLKVHGNTCYTYYKTGPTFKDEDFTIEIEFNFSKTDNCLYFGIINQNVITSSNCMCCSIKDAFYMMPNGDIALDGLRTNNPNLSYSNNKLNNAIFKVSTSEKKMWIQINNKLEQGPFAINGKEFTFTSGSCNIATGYIKIINAYYGC